MAAPFPYSLAKPQRKRRHFKRFHSSTKALINYVYSMPEIMRLYAVDEQTVRNWCKAGLKRVEGTSRFLVRGDELNAFHTARNAQAKQPLAPTEFYCLGCHEPREPSPGSIVGALNNKPALRLEARCTICETAVYRAWSREASEALLARPDFWPSSTSKVTEQPSITLDQTTEMQRNKTACDSVIHAKTNSFQKPTQTPKKHVSTHESSQLSLPFGF